MKVTSHNGTERREISLTQAFKEIIGEMGDSIRQDNRKGVLSCLGMELTPSYDRKTDYHPEARLADGTRKSLELFAKDGLVPEMTDKVTHLRLEHNGTSHEFPVRFEGSAFGGLRGLFNGRFSNQYGSEPLLAPVLRLAFPSEYTPVLVTEDLNGNEKRFQTFKSGSNFHRHFCDSAERIAPFFMDQMGDKLEQEGKARPPLPRRGFM